MGERRDDIEMEVRRRLRGLPYSRGRHSGTISLYRLDLGAALGAAAVATVAYDIGLALKALIFSSRKSPVQLFNGMVPLWGQVVATSRRLFQPDKQITMSIYYGRHAAGLRSD